MRFIRQHHQRFFRTHYAHALPVILLISAFMLLLDYVGAFQQYEVAGLDAIVRAKPQEASTEIFIVEITDADYHEKFQASSPLKEVTLGKLVRNVCSAGPATVVVDIETQAFDVEKCNVLWITPVETPEPSAAGFLRWFSGREGDIELKPKPEFHQPGEKAVSVFPIDRDGVVRRYIRSFKLEGDGDASMVSWLAAQKHLRLDAETRREQAHETMIFNFRAGRNRFPIIESRQFLDQNPQPGLAFLQGKVVLIGGNFSEGRDQYRTALGDMAGVELIAHAIDSDVHKSGVVEVPPYREILVDIAAGSLIAFLFWAFYITPAFFISLFGIPLAALAASAFMFRLFHYWLTFVPVVVGMVIHQLYDLARHAAIADELEEKVENLESELEMRRGAPSRRRDASDAPPTAPRPATQSQTPVQDDPGREQKS